MKTLTICCSGGESIKFNEKSIEMLCDNIDYIKIYIERWTFGNENIELEFKVDINTFLNIMASINSHKITYRCLKDYKDTVEFAKFLCYNKNMSAELSELYREDDIINDVLHTDDKSMRTLSIRKLSTIINTKRSENVYERVVFDEHGSYANNISITNRLFIDGARYTTIEGNVIDEIKTPNTIRIDEFLDLFNDIEGAKVVVAGGLANAFYTNRISINSNTDLYIITEDPNKVIDILFIISKHISKNPIRLRDYVTRSKNDITFSKIPRTSIIGSDDTCLLEIRVMLKTYKSISSLLNGFDIDCCCIAYDGNNFYYNDRYKRNVETGCIFINPHRNSPTYRERLRKYINRGYKLAMTGFNIDKVNIRRVETTAITGLAGIISYLLNNYEDDDDEMIPVMNLRNMMLNIMSGSRCEKSGRIIADSLDDVITPNEFINILTMGRLPEYDDDTVDEANDYMKDKIGQFKKPLLQQIQENNDYVENIIPCDNWFYELYCIPLD